MKLREEETRKNSTTSLDLYDYNYSNIFSLMEIYLKNNLHNRSNFIKFGLNSEPNIQVLSNKNVAD